MPVHDWTRVGAGTFHDFHSSWIVTLKAALNNGLLPEGYYALAEQIAGDIVPDVLTLQASDQAVSPTTSLTKGALAVEEAPPRVALMSESEEIDDYALHQRSLTIRHTSGDDVVAIVEIVSPGNKQVRVMLEQFVNKASGALVQGIHLLVVDLFPPGRHDPEGIHGAIWEQFSRNPFELPADRRLTLVAYAANVLRKAYIEPTAVGQVLQDMPLFITDRLYVNVPLERTYMEAYATVPERWRSVIEGRAN